MKRLRLLLALSTSLAWNCQIPRALAASANTAPTPNTAANGLKSPALQTLYRKAMEAYDAKRYDEASDLFKQVLVKQADHSSSKIFLARSLYQQKNISEAFRTFQQIDIKLLEPDAAYDYGQVAFRSNDYPTAIKAFAIVPNGHPLYDLAGYYGGISAYKMGEFQQSIDLFDQAVVLPSKLVRSQKLYRKEAEKKLLARQKHELQSGSVSNKTNDRQPPSPSAPVPAAFVLTPERGITLSHRYMNQTSETKKALSTEYDLSRSELKLTWGSDKPSASAKSQWVYFADLLGMTTHDGDKEIPVLPTADETLQYLALDRYKPKSMMRAEVAGGYETLIGDRATLGITVGAYSYAPDSDFAKNLVYSPYLSAIVSQKAGVLDTSFKAEAHPRYIEKKLAVTQILQQGTVNFNMTKAAYLGLTGEINEFNYNERRMDGEAWNGRIQLAAGYHQENSLSLQIGGFYEIASDWRLFDSEPEVPLAKFDLSQVGGFAKADMQLLSWLTVGINGRISRRTYSKTLPVEDLNAVPIIIGTEQFLDRSYGSKISQFALYISLKKLF